MAKALDGLRDFVGGYRRAAGRPRHQGLVVLSACHLSVGDYPVRLSAQPSERTALARIIHQPQGASPRFRWVTAVKPD